MPPTPRGVCLQHDPASAPAHHAALVQSDDLEMLDDIKPDLVNLTLSDSYLSNFSLNSKLTTTSDDCQISSDENEATVNSKSVLHLASPQSHFNASLEDLKQKDCSQQLGLLDNLSEMSLTEQNSNERLSTTTKICKNYGNLSFKRSPNLKCMLPIQNRMTFEKGKSSSLQDLHRLTSSPLLDKCHSVSSVRPIYSPSVSKSKDSGLPLSLSRLSLHSTDKSYENVQSKVKEYISNLKEAGRHRNSTQSSVKENVCYSSDDWEYSEEIKLDPYELLSTISTLRTELQDKDEMLRNLQDSYSALLMLHAETKNRIDQLRFNTSKHTLISQDSPMQNTRHLGLNTITLNAMKTNSSGYPSNDTSYYTLKKRECNTVFKKSNLMSNTETDSKEISVFSSSNKAQLKLQPLGSKRYEPLKQNESNLLANKQLHISSSNHSLKTPSHKDSWGSRNSVSTESSVFSSRHSFNLSETLPKHLCYASEGSDSNMPQSLTEMKKLQSGSDNTNLNSNRLLTLEGLNSTKKNILSPEICLGLDQEELSDCLQCSTEEAILKVKIWQKALPQKDTKNEVFLPMSVRHPLQIGGSEPLASKYCYCNTSSCESMYEELPQHSSIGRLTMTKENHVMTSWGSDESHVYENIDSPKITLASHCLNSLQSTDWSDVKGNSNSLEQSSLRKGKAWNNVLTYLSEMEVCARQMKGRSEAIKRVLLERLAKSASHNSKTSINSKTTY
uniref:Uncharacterized protein n=1 Tax=Timema bartmani TaxID=61472 RepID=A0A7R9EN46_9NEOP|nr:unnamed protein product [Timema bartmani]